MRNIKSKHTRTNEGDGRAEILDWQCFSYLTVEKNDLYRAIVQIFAAAKSEFKLHLRPDQIRQSLIDQDSRIEVTEVENALQALEGWGNLQSYQDNSDVSSLADYYRKRLLYQMTAAGEAAHASTLTFAQRIQQQAKLDARALDRIAESAGQLQRLAEQIRTNSVAIDSVVVLTTVRSICQDADELTSRAQSFFRWLHEQTESKQADLESFLSYKERLIEYLQEFVSQLIAQGAVIANRLKPISMAEMIQLAQLSAEEEVGEPRAGEEHQHAIQLEKKTRQWQQRLSGLRSWFSRSGGRSAQLEQLRAAARAAIPRLLQLASQMNERQSGRSDRVADLRALAVKFLACRDDSEAHRLYRASFALSSSRHLKVDQSTIEHRDQNPESNSTRWSDAEPIEFSPQLRTHGRQPAAASNRRVVNRTQQRAEAKRRISLTSGRNNSARETLVSLGQTRLSSVGELDTDTFRLLIELVELAVSKPNNNNVAQNKNNFAISRDGTLQIETRPVEKPFSSSESDDAQKPNSGESGYGGSKGSDLGNGKMKLEKTEIVPSPAVPLAVIGTKAGELMLPDMWFEVQRV